MKIGLVRRGYSASGGAERYLLRFADGLRAAGHEAVLFTSSDWPAEAWQGEIVRVEGGGPRAFADALLEAKPKERCDLVYSLERVWECDAYRAGDGVHRAWLDRRKRFEPAWKDWYRGMQRKHRDLMELERAIFDPAARRLIIANSQMVAGEIGRYFGTPEERVRVIYNGLPAEGFGLPAAREGLTGLEPFTARGSSDERVTALFVGSGWGRKGLRYAIAGTAKAENAMLVVAGAGKRRGLPVGAAVQYVGPVADTRALMARADVFVLPTIYDPFSNAALEAMAAGLPVITTTANGFAEVMRDGRDGVALEDPADSAGIAAAIDQWGREPVANREERREYARRFTIEENVRATVAALQEFLGKG